MDYNSVPNYASWLLFYLIIMHCFSVLQGTVFCKLTFLCFLDNWLWQKVSQCETSKNLELLGRKIKGDAFPSVLACFVQAPSK